VCVCVLVCASARECLLICASLCVLAKKTGQGMSNECGYIYIYIYNII
jgi:hypothetical protein